MLIPGLKEGILLEVGFDTTAPNRPCDISSWVWEYANDAGVSVFDNRALNVFNASTKKQKHLITEDSLL